jgi:hypothetical protein
MSLFYWAELKETKEKARNAVVLNFTEKIKQICDVALVNWN